MRKNLATLVWGKQGKKGKGLVSSKSARIVRERQKPRGGRGSGNV